MIFLLVRAPLGGQRSATVTEQQHLKPVGVIAYVSFFQFFSVPTAYTGFVSLSIYIYLFPNFTFSGNIRTPPPPSSLVQFWIQLHARAEIHYRHSPKTRSEPKKQDQKFLKRVRERRKNISSTSRCASPQGPPCTAGGCPTVSEVRLKKKKNSQDGSWSKFPIGEESNKF